MKLLLVVACLLPLAGCLDPDEPPPEKIIIEIKNLGDHSHNPTLTLTGPDGQIFQGKVSVPAKGSFTKEWDMLPGNYQAHVAYQFSGSSGGTNANYSGSRAHTWSDIDCRTDAIRILFTHTLNFGNNQNNFSTGNSAGYCE